jgi:hypothetical protein
LERVFSTFETREIQHDAAYPTSEARNQRSLQHILSKLIVRE